MTDEIPLADIASALARPLGQRVKRLQAERLAGLGSETPTQQSVFKSFDATLSRLTRLGEEANAWKQVWKSLEKAAISPKEFADTGAGEWLSDEILADSIKQLAWDRFLQSPSNPKIKIEATERLAQIVGQPEIGAESLIDQAIDILVAGANADMSPGEQHLNATIAARSDRISEEIEEVKRQVGDLQPDFVVTKSHTQEAEATLREIISRRILDTAAAATKATALTKRVATGDLRHAELKTQCRVLYWAARLLAPDQDASAEVKSLLERLQSLDQNYDTRVVEALLFETQGQVDSALRLLRDTSDPDERAVLFAILSRSRSEASSLAWLEEQEGWKQAGFTTGLGSFNVAVSLAKAEGPSGFLVGLIVPGGDRPWRRAASRAPALPVDGGTEAEFQVRSEAWVGIDVHLGVG